MNPAKERISFSKHKGFGGGREEVVLGEAYVVRGAPSHLGALQKCPSPVHSLALVIGELLKLGLLSALVPP